VLLAASYTPLLSSVASVRFAEVLDLEALKLCAPDLQRKFCALSSGSLLTSARWYLVEEVFMQIDPRARRKVLVNAEDACCDRLLRGKTPS